MGAAGAADGGLAGAGAAGGGDGAAADAAGAKKPRKRRPALEAYEADFIDDEEELEYERRRKAKAKFKGFYINKVSAGMAPAPVHGWGLAGLVACRPRIRACRG